MVSINGWRAHGQAVVFDLEVSNAFVASSLVDMFAKFEKLRDAQMVLVQIVENDMVLVGTLIVEFTQNDKNIEALEIFREMVDEGIDANEFTFANSIIATFKLIKCFVLTSRGVPLLSGGRIAPTPLPLGNLKQLGLSSIAAAVATMCISSASSDGAITIMLGKHAMYVISNAPQ
ncbi:Pentatricopeptide repeat [Dillenia turbinata]|uniref:Pentatricopeptide repeat n=1 Tax=Dillenia turbinata TaxID=194707 RepID=A0AAN8V9V4_9MAGN